MSTARFTAEIGPDLTIHLPADTGLTPGLVEVTIVQAMPSALEATPTEEDDFPSGVPEIVRHLVKFARAHHVPGSLPPDLAINHDHYLYGLPKRTDQG